MAEKDNLSEVGKDGEKIPDLPPQHIENLALQLKNLLSADTQELIQMLKHPRRFIWQNFLMGVVRGIGIAFGMTVLGAVSIALFLIVLHWLEGVPFIGGMVNYLIKIIRDLASQPPPQVGM